MQHEVEPTEGIAFAQNIVTILGCSSDSHVHISFAFLCGCGRYWGEQGCQSVCQLCIRITQSNHHYLPDTPAEQDTHLFSFLFSLFFSFFYCKKRDKSQDTLEWCLPKRIYTAQYSGKIRLWTVIHCNVKGSQALPLRKETGRWQPPVEIWHALPAHEPDSSQLKRFYSGKFKLIQREIM